MPLAAALALPAPSFAAASYVRTIGGPGHAPMYPSGVDVDGHGNVYVADTGNDRVMKFTRKGRRVWVRGARGQRAAGNFSNPRDLAYYRGRLYVADTEFNRVQVLSATTGASLAVWSYRFQSIIGISVGVTPGGRHVVLASQDVAADSPTGYVQEFTLKGAPIKKIGKGRLAGPRDAATDRHGNLFVADYAHDRVVEFKRRGGRRTWGRHGSSKGEFLRPYGIDIDARGRVYVADSDNDRIQEFTGRGRFVKQWHKRRGSGRLFQLRRVAVGGGRNPKIYAADLWGWKIVRYLHGGRVSRVFGGTAPRKGRFNEPSGVTVDPATGRLYVADAVNQRIQIFNAATGAYVGKWGQRGWGNGARNGFNWPRDIAFNGASGSSGYLWVADTKNNRLTAFSAAHPQNGPVQNLGTLGTGANQTHWPFAVAAVPGSKDIVVADTLNDRVQRWHRVPGGWSTSAGWTSTTAGGHGYANPLDVTVAGSNVYVADANNHRVVVLDAATGAFQRALTGGARLHSPEGVAVDAQGDLWVSDNSLDRLVELDPASDAVLQTVGGPHAGSGALQFSSPRHLEVWNGRLYVADTYNDRVQVFTNL